MRRKNRTKDYCVFGFFWTVGMDSDADTWRTPEKDAPGTVNLANHSVVLFMLLCFFFLLNLYIEAGLVYRTLSLQKDRAEKKDRNWGLSPPNAQTAFAWVCHNPHPSSALLSPFSPSLMKSNSHFSLKSSSEDKIVRKPGGSSTGQPDSVHTKW